MGICLVTGDAGFIGSNLVETPVQQQVKVRVIDNFSTGKSRNLMRTYLKIIFHSTQ